MKVTMYTVVLSLTMLACSGEKAEANHDSGNSTATIQQTPSATQAYMVVKDALVQTNGTAAKTAASDLVKALEAADMSAEMIAAANTIAGTEDVEAQRTAFKTVTDGLIAVLKNNETTDGVFVQYCPMAFGNTGASWLSLSNEIRNPYFGDRMLKCGRVNEEL